MHFANEKVPGSVTIRKAVRPHFNWEPQGDDVTPSLGLQKGRNLCVENVYVKPQDPLFTAGPGFCRHFGKIGHFLL